MEFEQVVLKALVAASEDRQQPVLDWLNAWKRCQVTESVILAGLRLEDTANDLVSVEVNGRVNLLLTYDQVEQFMALLKRS